MRILYLHQYFVPPSRAGGTRSFEFAKRLVARGHQVSIITSTAHMRAADVDPAGWGLDPPGALEISLIDVPYSNRMKYPERLRAFFKFAALASLRARRLSADVVFATSTPLTIAVPGVVAKKWLRAPLVFEVRDLWPEVPIAVGALRNPLARWLARRLERFAYRNADEIVALSPGMKEGIVRAGVGRDNVTVIPNGCDIDLFDVPAERGVRFRATMVDLDGDRPLVVYAGTMGRINRVQYLVELAGELCKMGSSTGVLLVGDGAERALALEAARRRGLLNKGVWFLDPVPKRSIPDVLAAATVCASVFAPIKEMENNSANKFFDALAAGKPVAINYGGWQADLLRRSGAGLVLPAEDIPAAARQVAEFVADPAKVAAAGAAARKLAVEQFDRERLTDGLEAVLFRAVARRAGRAAGDRPGIE